MATNPVVFIDNSLAKSLFSSLAVTVDSSLFNQTLEK